MVEAISIDAFLRLKTEDAVKQLAHLGKKQKPIAIPVKFTKRTYQAGEVSSTVLSSNIRRLNREISKVFIRINQPPPTPPGGGFLGKIERQLSKIDQTSKQVITTLKGLAGLAIGSIFIGGLDDVIRNISEVGLRFEQLETKINFVSGGAEEGAKTFKFLDQEAKRLRIDVEEAAKGFAGLAAAARGTSLEKESRRMFSALSQAARVNQLTADETQGAFLAVSQMISKGTVSAEELRGQLGERLPGAFQVAARSMNVTTEELGKLLQTGQITSEEFLPKFIKQLEKETRSGLAESLKTTSAALTNLQSEYKRLQVALSKSSRGITTLALDTVAKGLELVRKNLLFIKPVLQATAGLVAITLLPAALKLGKFLIGIVVKGLEQIISLLGVTNTQLGVTNAQLILLQTMSPKMAFLVKTVGALTAATKLLAGGLAVLGAMEIAKAWYNTAKAGSKVRDTVEEMEETFNKLNATLAKADPTSQSADDLVKANRKKLASTLNWYQKGTDGALKFARDLLKINRKEGDRGLFSTFEETYLTRTQAAIGDAIFANQKLLQLVDQELGLGDLREQTAEEIQAYVEAIEATSESLEKNLGSAVDSNQINAINTELDANQKRLDRYNKELERREGLELNLAKITLERNNTVTSAQQAETDALAATNAEMLKSVDFKKDVELQKLSLAKTRLDTELAAEKTALAKIKQLAKEKGSLDSETGKPRNAQQLAEFAKVQKRINELQRLAVANGIALTRKEVEQKLAEYDRYLDKLEDGQKEVIDRATIAEKEQLIEIQQLINDEVISKEQAEELKASQRGARIADELAQEEYKLHQLQKYTSTEVEVQEKRDEDIMASRQKILHLTRLLLQEEKTAEERTISAISKSKEDALLALEKRLSSLQQLVDAEANLVSARATIEEKLADLQISKLRQALELRKQLNGDDLNSRERRTVLRQLHSIGIDGKTDELSLLKQIEDREKKLAQFKLDNLEKQQQAEQAKLNIELKQLEVATLKANVEARKSKNTAEKELISAETAITNAQTDEELETANKLYKLAKLSVGLANEEIKMTDSQLEGLGSIINKKKENLALSQAIARAELKGTAIDDEFKREQERNTAREERARRFAQTLGKRASDELLSKYESLDEKVNKKLDSVKDNYSKLGLSFNEYDEARIEGRLRREGRAEQNNQESNKGGSTRGYAGFGIEAPAELLDAIRSGKPFAVPVIPKFKTNIPLEVGILGKIKVRTSESNMILKTLQNIEKKAGASKVINVSNDNQFINQYQKNETDELIRKIRSDLVEVVRSTAEFM